MFQIGWNSIDRISFVWHSRQSLSKTRWKSCMGDVKPLPTSPAKWSEQHKGNIDLIRMNMVHTVSIRHYPKKFWMVAIISLSIPSYPSPYPKRQICETFRWTTMILPGHSEVWVIGVCVCVFLWQNTCGRLGLGNIDVSKLGSLQRTPWCPTIPMPHEMPANRNWTVSFAPGVVAATPQKDTCFWWAPDITVDD